MNRSNPLLGVVDATPSNGFGKLAAAVKACEEPSGRGNMLFLHQIVVPITFPPLRPIHRRFLFRFPMDTAQRKQKMLL